jgi:hypothetical protein
MSILNRPRHLDWPLPIYIIVALPIGNLPDFIFRQISAIINHIIVCRCAHSLSDILGDHIEIEILTRYPFGYYSTTSRILFLLGKKFLMNLFINYNKS